MRKLRLVILAAVALALSTAFAQQPGTNQPSGNPAQGAQAGNQASTPNPGRMATRGMAEMQKLQPLAGTWITVETFEPSDFAPKGGTGTGRAEFHPGPGRLSMLLNYHSRNAMMGPFSGHGVFWYDQKDQVYRSFWCDSMNGCENSFATGKWDDDRLVFEGQSEMHGKKMSMRDTVSDIKPDSFTWTEEISTDGGPMKKVLTIQYTRRSGPPPATKPDTKQ